MRHWHWHWHLYLDWVLFALALVLALALGLACMGIDIGFCLHGHWYDMNFVCIGTGNLRCVRLRCFALLAHVPSRVLGLQLGL